MAIRSPEQQFAFAKTLPMNELVKVMQGQSDVVDMYIADMMLRQKMPLIKAQQGAQAMQVARGPKVAEKDVAEAQQLMQPEINQGVASLPADIDVPEYAGGGIVAFDDGGRVEHYQNQGYVNPYGRYTGMSDPRSNLFQYTSEEEEEQRLLKNMSIAEQIRYLAQKYGVNRSLQDIVAGRTTPTAASAAPAAPVAPKEFRQGTQADVRKADIAAGGAYSPAMPAQAAPFIPKSMQMGDLAPVAPSLDTVFARANQLVNRSMGAAPGEITTRQGVANVREALTEAGFDPEFHKKQIEELRKEKAGIKGERQEAINMRMLEMGLGILGGESPYAFVNIGKGASPALKGLQEDFKDIKKIDRERDKAIRDLQTSEQDLKKATGLAGLAEVQKARERVDKYNELRANKEVSVFNTLYSGMVQEKIAAMPGQTERLISRMGEPGFAERAQQFYKIQGTGGRADAAVIQEYMKNPTKLELLKDTDPNLYNYIKAQIALMSVPSTVNAPAGPVYK